MPQAAHALSFAELKQPRINRKLAQWATPLDQPLDPESLNALFENKIPAIRVPGFATSQECAELASLIHELGVFEGYTFKSTANSILKIGPAQCEFPAERKAAYFEAGVKAQRLLNALEARAFNPVERLKSKLGEITTVEIPEEKGFGNYFAGVIRNLSKGGLLHMDFAPWDARGWALEGVQSQISWNLYLKAPVSGGECTVHHKPWDISCEVHKVDGSYHYDRRVVDGAEKKVNRFVEGDLVFFNSRNFHEIAESEGLRLTMSSFVGRFADGRTVLWS